MSHDGQHQLLSRLPVHQPQVLLDHLAADGMIKVTVFLERLEREITVDLVEAAKQRPDELHAAHLPEQIRNAGIYALVLGPQRDLVEGRLEFGIL